MFLGLPPWLLGVALNIIGSIVDNAGISMQKYSHIIAAREIINGKRSSTTEKPYYQRKWWVAGMTLFLLGNAVNAIGLAFAPETLFAALATFALVANAFNAHMFLGERLTPRILLGTFLIISGSIIACLFGSHTKESFTVQSLEHLIDAAFLIYSGALVILLACLLVSIFVIENVIGLRKHVKCPSEDRDVWQKQEHEQEQEQEQEHEKGPEREHSEFSGPTGGGKDSDSDAIIGTPDLSVQLVSLPTDESLDYDADDLLWMLRPLRGLVTWSRHDSRLFLSFGYPAFAGLIGSITVLLAKVAAELIKSTFRGENQLQYVSSYIIIASTLITGVVQVHWLNMGLRKFDQLVVVPAFFVVYTTFSIIGGAVFFEELKSFSSTEWVLFPLGTAVTFVGVYLLSTSTNVGEPLPTAPPHNHDHDREHEYEYEHEHSTLLRQDANPSQSQSYGSLPK